MPRPRILSQVEIEAIRNSRYSDYQLVRWVPMQRIDIPLDTVSYRWLTVGDLLKTVDAMREALEQIRDHVHEHGFYSEALEEIKDIAREALKEPTP